MRLLPIILSLAIFVQARRAFCDGGAWLWADWRVPIASRNGKPPRLAARVMSDTRFSADRGGLAQQFLRVGLIYSPLPWLILPVNGVAHSLQGVDERFVQQLRLELEPTIDLRLGPFVLNDRNRLEYLWTDSVVTVRYRNRLWINFAPKSWRAFPFIWNELFVQILGGVNQNRAAVGVGLRVQEGMRLDVMYMLQSIRSLTGAWAQNHLGILSLTAEWPLGKKD